MYYQLPTCILLPTCLRTITWPATWVLSAITMYILSLNQHNTQIDIPNYDDPLAYVQPMPIQLGKRALHNQFNHAWLTA